MYLKDAPRTRTSTCFVLFFEDGRHPFGAQPQKKGDPQKQYLVHPQILNSKCLVKLLCMSILKVMLEIGTCR